MIRVLSAVMGSDPAGISSGIAKAFRNDPEYEVRSLISKLNYIAYPPDLPWERAQIIEAWESADLVHLHHGFVTADRMVRARYVGKRLPPKPYIVTFHGTGFREGSEAHLRELRERQAIGTCSTLDLFLLGPEDLEWLPPPVDVTGLARMRCVTDPNKVIVAHAPTNRQIKSTDLLIEAVERLQAEGFPVELDLIERVTWNECLERKARADIYFDQIILGYGCNALEAWGMGIPVIAGAADPTLDEMERRFGQLPFYHATAETVYDALKELVESPELRERYGQIGHDYVRKYHDYPVVREQLKSIYRKALEGSMENAA